MGCYRWNPWVFNVQRAVFAGDQRDFVSVGNGVRMHIRMNIRMLIRIPRRLVISAPAEAAWR